jgi:hypothetical protein
MQCAKSSSNNIWAKKNIAVEDLPLPLVAVG